MKPMSRLLPSACVAVFLFAVAGCDEQPAKPVSAPAAVEKPAPSTAPSAAPATADPAGAPASAETQPASSEAAPTGYSVTSPIKAAPIKPVQQRSSTVEAGKSSVTQAKAPAPEVSKPVARVSPARAASKPEREKSAVEQKLPPIKLDLSLPRELVEGLHHGEPLVEEKPLLPPLFVEKEAKPAPFQLSGKLITNEHERDRSGEKLERDNYFDKVDGAQLNFEFRN